MELRSQATELEQNSNDWSYYTRWSLYVALFMNAFAITLSFKIYRLYKI